MARSLSCIVKGMAGLPATHSWRTKVTLSSYFQHVMGHSTTAPSDPDTHEDFQPTNKLASSGLSAKDIVEQDIKENPVMIYMKGLPDAPRCGFSALAVRVLKEYGVPISARNILEDPELKSGVKSFSNWPTFPQIFIKGEFIGGSDIILSMHQICWTQLECPAMGLVCLGFPHVVSHVENNQNGELKEKLQDANAETKQS